MLMQYLCGRTSSSRRWMGTLRTQVDGEWSLFDAGIAVKRVEVDGEWSLTDAEITAKIVEVATCRGRRPVSRSKIFKFTTLWQAAIIFREYRQINRPLRKHQW